MSEFFVFFEIGFFHIIHWEALDHLLFLLVLCAIYQFQHWKKVFLLVTAFTIGHSLTLILTALDYLNFDKGLIEFLIPFTILITGVVNFFEKPTSQDSQNKFSIYLIIRYIFALCFGLVHGLAYAQDLKSLFSLSKDGVILKLLSFNIGIEAGQIVAVLGILFFSTLFITLLKTKPKLINYTYSGASCLMAGYMMLDRGFLNF